ncbi:hypothetical protein AGMMS4956_02860 [Bacteroidia bacterium]|nr:hypothetical protein AGMMS4956_02860 [Bacteroidia bacterium]
MKTIRFLVVAMGIALMTSLAGCYQNKSIVQKHGQLSVQGTQLVDKNGKPVVLRGVSFGWHNWWYNFYNPTAVHTLVHDWNATLLRAAIGVQPEGAYLYNPELAIRCATTVVDAAIKEGVYVIIDWHSHDIVLEQAKEFFTLMATKYKNSPNVIYELFNEPDFEEWSDVKAYSIELIDLIRGIAPQSVILVGLPHWDQDVHLVADDPIEGYDNLMYTMHFYAATHKAELRARSDYALSKGLPLFVSECAGMEASGDSAIDTESWNTWVQWMNQRNISWVAWSISGKVETCSMLIPTAKPDGQWDSQDLKEWALIVKNQLAIDN